MRLIILLVSHAVAAAVGFVVGIYALPILTAPQAPDAAMLEAAVRAASYSGRFRRDLKDSDALHWGEGNLFVGPRVIAFEGSLAPGPDYKLYLAPEFVETEADFLQLKPSMALIGDVKTFDNFVVAVPKDIDPEDYDTAIVWCESFAQFISAARYR